MASISTTTYRNLFCYGSLKQGFSRHWLLQGFLLSGDAFYLGEAKTVEKYPLILRPSTKIPALLNFPGILVFSFN